MSFIYRVFNLVTIVPIIWIQKKRYKNTVLRFSYLILTVCFTTCVEPVEPEFDLITGLITVEGIISNEEGASFVKIQESELDFVFKTYVNVFISGANVTFINTNTSEVVSLTENIQADGYLPPNGFVASVGDTWELDIKLADGRHYKSLPEKIIKPVTIKDIEAIYEPELEFYDERGYLPGHQINISFDDPADEKNYYYWNFKSFETKTLCLTCWDSFYRDGYCNDFGVYPTPFQRESFPVTYLCETDCWRIRYAQKVEILDDEFINGSTINKLPVADVLLFNKKDILVEVRQFSLSKPAYNYYKVLKDVVENNGGFNAPPPAALVGNMYNANNDKEYVLGRFTAAGTSKKGVFIDRSTLLGQIEGPDEFFPESGSNPIPPGLPPVYYYPCIESFYSTSIKPDGWPN